MRKREWASCKDPQQMLHALVWADSCEVNEPGDERGGWVPGPITQRRLRLFTLAAGKRLWANLEHPPYRSAVEVACRQAEGEATPEEVAEQCTAVGRAYHAVLCRHEDVVEMARLLHVVLMLLRYPLEAAISLVTPVPLHGNDSPAPLLTPGETACCCGLLRELFGDRGHPFLVTDFLHPAWLTPAVVQLAQALYDERRFEDLPVLADALEEAGCTEATVLEHLRGPGPHLPGCWAVDALLGKPPNG